MAVLALREFERIRCGTAFDAAAHVVTEQQHRALEHFAESYKRRRGIDIFLHGPRRSLVAQNYVGVVNLGPHQIEVLPKVEGSTDEVRRSLAQMIAQVLGLELHGHAASAMCERYGSLLEILIRLFCAELWRVLHKGVFRRYESRAEVLTVLRGRLSVSAQIRENLARPDRLSCEFDEFTENNRLNQLLRAALRILQHLARNQQNQRTIAELLFVFHDVDDIAPQRIACHPIETDRLAARYRHIVRMALLIVESRSPDVVAGAGSGFALLFDMNELFEEYVGRLARRLLRGRGLKVELQGPRRYLARRADGAPSFELRPDIVVSDSDSVQLIADTKWKRLKENAFREGVAPSDIYQMHAYARRYLAPEVVLLYPHHSGLGNWQPRRAEYFVAGEIESHALMRTTESTCIAVASLDLRNLAQVEGQLEQVFALGRTQ